MRHVLVVLTMLFFVLPGTGCSSNEDVEIPPDLTAALDEEDSHEDRIELQKEIIRRQRLEIQRQNRELEDLKRQQFYNESYRRFEKKD